MIEKIQSLLTENEEILSVGRIHWIVFVPPSLYCLIAFIAAIFFHPLLGGVILLVSLYPIYNALIYFWMTYLVLTNKKVLSRVGFLSRDWTRMDFDRVENAFLEEPIIGRALGYSTIIISGVGSGSIAINHIKNGDQFIKALEKQLADNKTPNNIG